MVSDSIDNLTPHRELAASAMMACGVLLAVKISSSSEQLGPGCTGRGSENKTDLDKAVMTAGSKEAVPHQCLTVDFPSSA